MHALTIGAGHNPFFDAADESRRLKIPACVELLEVGVETLAAPGRLKADGRRVALHVSRSPIVEDEGAQSSFVEHLFRVLPRCQSDFIGLHLTGSRFDGIGRYGFSSHYAPSKESEDRACSFVERLQRRFGSPVALENANFYSSCFEEIAAAWRSLRAIRERTGALVILDLSHAAIDALNIGVPPESILGLVPWEGVREMHLSGIVKGADGALHDGHALPVHDEAWRLLDLCLERFLPHDAKTCVTIEHTDAAWEGRGDELSADFERLRARLSTQAALPAVNRAGAADSYARGYLKKILKRRVPLAEPACRQRGVSFDSVYDEWIAARLDVGALRLSFSSLEIPDGERGAHRVAAEDFAEFVRARLTDGRS